MPTTSGNHKVYLPRRIPVFQNGHTIAPIKSISPMTMEHFAPFDVVPPPDTQFSAPQEIDISMDDVKEIKSEKKDIRRFGFWWAILLALLASAIIATSIAVPLVLNQRATTDSTDLDVSSSLSTTIISTATTTATTTVLYNVTCVYPYILSSTGSCVNVLIDMNNCGSPGYNCSSNYTSCSAGVCSRAPGVQLANSNFLWTAAVNGSVDDSYFGMTLPFNITLYTTTTNYVYVTTNGVVCLQSCSAVYTETALPSSTFPGATAFAYWDDLYIYAGTSQGIYSGVEGNAPNRSLIFEFYMSHFQQPNQYYHYQVIFFEAAPGVVQYKYFDASDGGVTCTIGVQASGSGPSIQYSFDLANSVRSNMSLTFNTNLGTYTNSTF